MKEVRIGADVGGTFTDVVRYGRDGMVSIHKTLSTAPDYEGGVVSGIAAVLDRAQFRVEEVVHGTTVATNAVLERRGARTALITTMGFRDVLELRRLRMPHMYDLFWQKPEPLVERHLRLEVNARTLADGTVVAEVDSKECQALAETLSELDVESVAVALLHSHLYPQHEEDVARELRTTLPHLPITLSSDILREEGEYERTATAVVNAYVQPLMSEYLEKIGTGLEDNGVFAPLRVMQSSGGLMSADDAKERPVLALESGPAAGVVAAQNLATRLGYSDAIAFDMGGTTAKASLIEAGQISRGSEYEAGGDVSIGSRLIRGSGELLRIPNIDIAEVGAGGGSMAWLDAAGGLQVGPRSAGSHPGPACYGFGGTEPTVTDANVVLGFIPSGEIADSVISISPDSALAAIEKISSPLNLNPIQAASGIHQLANARMMRALRAVSSERGRDPREHVLIAYGGSGPVHAANLADELGIRTVVVPAFAGVFSAVGLLFARTEFHAVRTCQIQVKGYEESHLLEMYTQMEGQVRHSLGATPIAGWKRSADLRYRGQSWEVEVDLPDVELASGIQALVASFEDEHERLYSVRPEPGSPVEIRAVRSVAFGPDREDDEFRLRFANEHQMQRGEQSVFLGKALVKVPIVLRGDIPDRWTSGPLVIREYDTTVLVPPTWSVKRDSDTESLILNKSEMSNG